MTMSSSFFTFTLAFGACIFALWIRDSLNWLFFDRRWRWGHIVQLHDHGQSEGLGPDQAVRLLQLIKSGLLLLNEDSTCVI